MTWTIELLEEQILADLYDELGSELLKAALESNFQILTERGLGLLQTNMMKSLGNGLYEFRIRKSPELLIRVFMTMIHPNRLVIVSAYNKGRDSSELRQRREIKKARNLIDTIQGRK